MCIHFASLKNLRGKGERSGDDCTLGYLRTRITLKIREQRKQRSSGDEAVATLVA